MQEDFPIKNLLKYSGRCSIAVAGIVFITGSTVETSISVVCYRSGTTFLLFLTTCLINLGLLKCWEKRGTAHELEFDLRHFVSGYVGTMTILLLLNLLNNALIQNGVLPPTYMGEKVHIPANSGMFWLHLVVVTFIIYVLVYYFHNFILLLFAKNRTEREISELKLANFETANQLLRQQIQPHFLFNALNVLKSLIRKYPETAEHYLVRLSDFLRASLTVNKTDTATVSDELKLCEDYMSMQKIRFGESLHYQVLIADDDPSLRDSLPFFSLQPLLENAIKHNQLTEALPLTITVSREGEWVEVKNNLQLKNFVDGSTGNGLFNLKERYRILSGDEVDIRITEDTFTVRVKILTHQICKSNQKPA